MKYASLLLEVPRGLLFIFLYGVRALSFLFPRSGKIWIFDSWRGERFADNAKYLFLFLNKNVPGITYIWLSRSTDVVDSLRARGYRAYRTNSLQGLYYTARAQLHIFDSHPPAFNYWVAGGARTVDLWHGLPFKKLFEDAVNTKQHNWLYSARGVRWIWHSFFNPRHHVRGDYVLIPGMFWADIFSRAFRVEKNHLLIAGYPRNEVLLSDVKDSDVGIDTKARGVMEKIQSNKEKIVVYMPTFRDGKQNPIVDGILDFEELDAFFREHRAHFFLKFHHEKTLQLNGRSNVHIIESATDAYPLMRFVDVLVTDYSGIFFDFLLFDRPIVLFPFDIDDYTSKRRELYFDYDTMIAGPKAYTVEELLAHVRAALEGIDEHAEKRQVIRSKVFDSGVNDNPSALLYKQLQTLV